MPPVHLPSEDRHLYAGTYSGSAFRRESHNFAPSPAPLTRMVVSFAAVAAFVAVVVFALAWPR